MRWELCNVVNADDMFKGASSFSEENIAKTRKALSVYVSPEILQSMFEIA